MLIIGKASSRTKGITSRDKPPSEAELITKYGRENKNRISTILEITNWTRIEPGTLNVEVDTLDFDRLLSLDAAMVEPGETVFYPVPYKHIPLEREEYYYYKALLKAQNDTIVLVRRPKTTPLKGRLEIFSEVHLRNLFGIQDNENIELEIIH